ncbi:MAG: N-acetyltransferase [Flavobacteriaceae bacterium]|nr:N-acetyltransferase [Flavobacteriaceae bacterium]|tara:strand:- start:7511 stop:7795 length:285 start_codon:yes stop_codon:yes gene_type:complete
MEINDNTFLRQFETKAGRKLAIIEYSVQERKIFLTKIIVPEIKNKDVFVDEFISSVLEIIRDRNISVVPTVPTITKYIRRNRRFKSLLPVGIRI